MNNGTPVCPACGSTSTYVRKRDGDDIPAEDEEKRYYPVPVPDDLPPVDEVRVSFDGGKTHWVFVASHLAEGGGL